MKKSFIVMCISILQVFASNNISVKKAFTPEGKVSSIHVKNHISKEGLFIIYYPKTTRFAIKQYKNGKLNGVSITMRDQDKIELVANYKDGVMNGESTYYSSNGTKIMTYIYNKGKLTFPFYFHSDDQKSVIEVSENKLIYNKKEIDEKLADKIIDEKFQEFKKDSAKFGDKYWFLVK